MELPPSDIDTDDLRKYPRGPNGLARVCVDRIAELEEAKVSCRTRAERKPINKQIHLARDMLRWCKTRAGYVPTPADLGLVEPDELAGESNGRKRQ